MPKAKICTFVYVKNGKQCDEQIHEKSIYCKAHTAYIKRQNKLKELEKHKSDDDVNQSEENKNIIIKKHINDVKNYDSDASISTNETDYKSDSNYDSETSTKSTEILNTFIIKNPKSDKDFYSVLIYNNQQIKCILQESNELYFRGKDVANVLEYKDTNKAITQHVNESDKITLKKIIKNLGSILRTPVKLSENEKNTIYITESGMYSLIFGSKMKVAKTFKHWVTSKVLPELRKTGTYSLKDTITQKPIRSFYNTKYISDFYGKNVVYIIYVGSYENKEYYKFGISSRIFEREFMEHRKAFETTEVVYITECDNNAKIEKLFKQNLKTCNLLKSLTIKNKTQTELFFTTIDHSLERLKVCLDELINEHKLLSISEKDKEIELLKIQKDKDIELKNKDIELINAQKNKELVIMNAQKDKDIELKNKDVEIINAQKNKELAIMNASSYKFRVQSEIRLKELTVKEMELSYKIKSLDMTTNMNAIELSQKDDESIVCDHINKKYIFKNDPNIYITTKPKSNKR